MLGSELIIHRPEQQVTDGMLWRTQAQVVVVAAPAATSDGNEASGSEAAHMPLLLTLSHR
jgi:hypothetical protein